MYDDDDDDKWGTENLLLTHACQQNADVKELTWYSDHHGEWLQLPKRFIPKKARFLFSVESFEDSKHVYLCSEDARLYRHILGRFGIWFPIREVFHQESPVRKKKPLAIPPH